MDDMGLGLGRGLDSIRHLADLIADHVRARPLPLELWRATLLASCVVKPDHVSWLVMCEAHILVILALLADHLVRHNLSCRLIDPMHSLY